MRIAYMASDEVNRALAVRLAAKCGAVVWNLRPNDCPPDGEFDAVLWNLDDLPTDLQAALLEGLRHGAPDSTVAVHGYDVTDEKLNALHRSGVAAAQRLDIDLLRHLCKAVRRARARLCWRMTLRRS